jgi:hypothetical protein
MDVSGVIIYIITKWGGIRFPTPPNAGEASRARGNRSEEAEVEVEAARVFSRKRQLFCFFPHQFVLSIVLGVHWEDTKSNLASGLFLVEFNKVVQIVCSNFTYGRGPL